MNRQDEELWMKKMREALSDYSEPPAPDGWSKLEKELAPVAAKRIRPYTWWAVAATLLLAVSGISLFFMQSPTADDIRHTMPPTLAVTPDVMPEPQEPERLITQAKPEVKPIAAYTPKGNKTTVKTDVRPTVDYIIPTEIDLDNVVEVVMQPFEPEEETNETTGDNERKTDNVSDEYSGRQVVKPSGKDKLHLPVATDKKGSSDGKWSVAASFSNAAGASTNQTQDYLVMADFAPSQNGALSSGMIPVNDKSELVFDGGVPYLKQSATISEIKHKQPISFGLSVRKNLAKGFSIESGVTYTMLSSEGKSVNNPSEKVEQKLHYIGIPLRGNWDFVQSKRFTVYLTAGGMVEKSVYGKIGTKKHTVKPLQFSLTGGVGGQLNISDRIGIYVEPGVSYFFDDGSDVETIRKENPLNFNLQGGIRFTY